LDVAFQKVRRSREELRHHVPILLPEPGIGFSVVGVTKDKFGTFRQWLSPLSSVKNKDPMAGLDGAFNAWKRNLAGTADKQDL
jgi:hypothetical protein